MWLFLIEVEICWVWLKIRTIILLRSLTLLNCLEYKENSECQAYIRSSRYLFQIARSQNTFNLYLTFSIPHLIYCFKVLRSVSYILVLQSVDVLRVWGCLRKKFVYCKNFYLVFFQLSLIMIIVFFLFRSFHVIFCVVLIVFCSILFFCCI